MRTVQGQQPAVAIVGFLSPRESGLVMEVPADTGTVATGSAAVVAMACNAGNGGNKQQPPVLGSDFGGRIGKKRLPRTDTTTEEPYLSHSRPFFSLSSFLSKTLNFLSNYRCVKP